MVLGRVPKILNFAKSMGASVAVSFAQLALALTKQRNIEARMMNR